MDIKRIIEKYMEINDVIITGSDDNWRLDDPTATLEGLTNTEVLEMYMETKKAMELDDARFVKKVGDLEVYAKEEIGGLFGDVFTVYVKDGNGKVKKEHFDGKMSAFSLEKAVNHLLEIRYDILSLDSIIACFDYDNITEESVGDPEKPIIMLSGPLPGFDTPEYFTRIGSTYYYKHHIERPEM